MDVRDLRQRLANLEATLSTWGAKSGDIADLKRLTDALEPFDALPVAAFCNQLANLTSDGVPPAPTKPSRAAAKAKLDEAVVERFVAAFSSDALDYDGLRIVLAELTSDGKVKAQELSAIASRLAGADGKYSKTKALEKIEAVVRRRLDTRRRLDGTSGIF